MWLLFRRRGSSFVFAILGVLSPKFKVSNSVPLSLWRWTSSQEQKHQLNSNSTVQLSNKKNESFQKLIVTPSQNLFHSMFFPWLLQMQGALLNT